MFVKNWSGHIIFQDNFQWKELEKSFPEIWEIFSKESRQSVEEVQYDQANLFLNMEEIRKNRKPMGYMKDGAKYRFIFPLDRKELIIYRGIPTETIREMTDQVVKVLRASKLKFNVEYDKMLLQDIRARRK